MFEFVTSKRVKVFQVMEQASYVIHNAWCDLRLSSLELENITFADDKIVGNIIAWYSKPKLFSGKCA